MSRSDRIRELEDLIALHTKRYNVKKARVETIVDTWFPDLSEKERKTLKGLITPFGSIQLLKQEPDSDCWSRPFRFAEAIGGENGRIRQKHDLLDQLSEHHKSVLDGYAKELAELSERFTDDTNELNQLKNTGKGKFEWAFSIVPPAPSSAEVAPVSRKPRYIRYAKLESAVLRIASGLRESMPGLFAEPITKIQVVRAVRDELAEQVEGWTEEFVTDRTIQNWLESAGFLPAPGRI